jgi:hypothetical protein
VGDLVLGAAGALIASYLPWLGISFGSGLVAAVLPGTMLVKIDGEAPDSGMN